MKKVIKIILFPFILAIIAAVGLLLYLIATYNFGFKLNEKFLENAYEEYLEIDTLRVLVITGDFEDGTFQGQANYTFYENMLEVGGVFNTGYTLFIEEDNHLLTYNKNDSHDLVLVSDVEITESYIESVKVDLLSQFISGDFDSIDGRSYLFTGEEEYEIVIEWWMNRVEYVYYTEDDIPVSMRITYDVEFPPEKPIN